MNISDGIKNKTLVYLLFFLFVFSLFPINTFTNPNNNTVVAQTWENQYGKLEVYPDTSTEMVRQKQWANLTWYYPDNILTVAFGFPHRLDYGKLYRIINGNYIPVNDIDYIFYNNQHFYVTPDFNVEQDHTYYFYWEFDAIGSGKWDLYAKLASDTWIEAFSSNRFIHLDPWWNSNWQKSVTWWISQTYIGSTLSNFPVLFPINSTIANSCQVDGGDLRFIDSTNTTEFNYDIELWNASGTSYVWVNVTSVSSSARTQINMYYNNSAASNGWNTGGTWDSNYTAVYHMNHTSGNTLWDSTSNHNDGTGFGNETEINRTIGYAQFFSDADYYILPSGTFQVAKESTVMCWQKESHIAEIHPMYEAAETTGTNSFHKMLPYAATSDIYFDYYFEGAYIWNDGPGIRDTYPAMYTHAFDLTSHYDWKNSTSIGTSWGIGTNLAWFTPTLFRIGTDRSFTNFFDGWIDEFRISNNKRSMDYTNATYHTTNMTPGFLISNDIVSSEMNSPTNFYANTSQNGNIVLEWVKGTNTTDTYIEYHTISSWDRGSGTFLYNSTGVTTTHTTLSCGTKYYYEAWGYNSTTGSFSNPAQTNNISCPANPTSTDAIVYGNYINITWILGVYGDNTTLVRKENSFPSSPTDGTIVQNNSLLYYNNTYTNTYRYKLFTWNTTVKRHSTGVERSWGGITINVYDENTSLAIKGWDIFISNQDKTNTYESTNNSNPLVIDIALLPYGTNTMIKINATNYSFKIYYMNLEVNNQYTLNAYLVNVTAAPESYIIRIIDETDEGVNGASVYVKRYINSTVGYQNISILLTDSNGYCPAVQLIPNEDYAVNIICTGYNTATYDIHPIHIVYVEDRYFTFQISYTTTNVFIWDYFYTNITFYANMSSTTEYNGTINIFYQDKNSSTINTKVYVYDTYNNSDIVLLNSCENITNVFINIFNGVNTTHTYKVVLWFNNTADFQDLPEPGPHIVIINNLLIYVGPFPPRNLDDRITKIIGPLTINGVKVPYADVICVIIVLFFMFAFSYLSVGLSLITGGGIIGLVVGLFQYWNFTDAVNADLIGLCPLFIIIGILYMLTRYRDEEVL